MKMLLRYLNPYKWHVTLGMFIKFAGTLMDLLLPWILAHIIDEIIPLKDVGKVFLWGGAMLLCSLTAWGTNVIANRMAAWVSKNAIGTMRHDLFRKISVLSCSQVDDFSIPSLISRITSDTYNIHSMISVVQRMGVRAPILLLGGITVTVALEPVLASILVVMLPLLSVVIYFVTHKGIPMYRHLQAGIDRMVQVMRENIVGVRVIKALSTGDYEKKRFDDINREVVRREKKAVLTMAITNPSMNFFLNLGLVLVILVGAFRVDGGVSQPGKIIAFMNYFILILNAVMGINRIFMMCTKGLASADRINKVLETQSELGVLPEKEKQEPAHIVFRHVNFAYEGMESTLHNISFSIRHGETLGIIGSTGSGKTAVINLLMRLYDADSGDILIDGKPVSSIPEEELHTKFGVVFQNDVLFADTIAENISFGRGLSRERLTEAVRDAQAMEFIASLPEGLDYPLAIKGSNLSGGQKQRLLIARALAGRPEILILDDSSSALDYQTDADLRQAVQAHYAGTTSIIIAQRISSIQHADHILVLEEGETVGYGTHKQLMEECEIYREISQSQMGGGTND